MTIARNARQTSKMSLEKSKHRFEVGLSEAMSSGDGPRVAKIGFVAFVGKGLIRNNYRQARQRNLENEAWKYQGSPERIRN